MYRLFIVERRGPEARHPPEAKTATTERATPEQSAGGARDTRRERAVRTRESMNHRRDPTSIACGGLHALMSSIRLARKANGTTSPAVQKPRKGNSMYRCCSPSNRYTTIQNSLQVAYQEA